MINKLIQKYQTETLILLGFTVIYFLTRLYNLTALPIFTDEAIYIRWGQIAANDAAWRFISLTDGKQPLFIWLMMPMFKIFHDPLFAGRIVSVFAGFGTMLGLFFFGKELFKNKWVGIISAGIYLIYPFGLVYDRMALYDSLVGAFYIWGLYVEVLLVRRVRLDISFILALVLGGGMLTKTNAFFTSAFLPFTLLLFDWKEKERGKRLRQWITYAVIASVLAYVYYSVLRLSPFFHIIDEKNTTFVYPIKDWIHEPFAFVFGNTKGLLNWLAIYMSIPLILLVGVFFYGKKHWREILFCFLAFGIPITYFAFFGKVIYPRHILLMTLPLLPVMAFVIVKLKEKLKAKAFIVGILFLWYLYADFFIITNLARAPIPQTDLDQFVVGWPAGVGVKESITFFKEQSQNGPIYIATQGTFGLMPFALEMYFQSDPNVTIKGYWPTQDVPPADVMTIAKKMPTYFLFYQPCPSCQGFGVAPLSWPVKNVLSIKKGDSNNYLNIYQIIPAK